MSVNPLIPLLLTAAYIIGSVPISLILGKVFYGIDVREHGSRNAGATNTFRVLGPGIGMPVLILDMFKGWAALYISVFSGLESPQIYWLQIALGVLVTLGHVYPVFANFRGGKGVASLFGVFLFLFTIPVLLSLGVFIVIFVASGYVSLGSMIAGISLPLFAFLFERNAPLYLIYFTIFISLFVIYTHRENIKRLKTGNENRFNIFRSKEK